MPGAVNNSVNNPISSVVMKDDDSISVASSASVLQEHLQNVANDPAVSFIKAPHCTDKALTLVCEEALKNLPEDLRNAKIVSEGDNVKTIIGFIYHQVMNSHNSNDKAALEELCATFTDPNANKKQLDKAQNHLISLVRNYWKSGADEVINQFLEHCKLAWKEHHGVNETDVIEYKMFTECLEACKQVLNGVSDKLSQQGLPWENLIQFHRYFISCCASISKTLNYVETTAPSETTASNATPPNLAQNGTDNQRIVIPTESGQGGITINLTSSGGSVGNITPPVIPDAAGTEAYKSEIVKHILDSALASSEKIGLIKEFFNALAPEQAGSFLERIDRVENVKPEQQFVAELSVNKTSEGNRTNKSTPPSSTEERNGQVTPPEDDKQPDSSAQSSKAKSPLKISVPSTTSSVSGTGSVIPPNETQLRAQVGLGTEHHQPQGNNNQERLTTWLNGSTNAGSTDGGSASAGGSTGSPTLPHNASAGTPLNNDGTDLRQLEEVLDFQISKSQSEPSRPRSNSTSSAGRLEVGTTTAQLHTPPREEHLVPNIPDLRNENSHTVPLGRELNRTETANTEGTQPQGNNNQEQQTTRSTGSTDAGSTDAGSTDAGSTDAGSTDAGSTDAGSTDAGSTNAGSTDAGSTNAGSTNAGSTDGGSASAGGSTGSPTLPHNASAGTPLNNDGSDLLQRDEMTDFQIPGSHSEPNRPRSNSTFSTGRLEVGTTTAQIHTPPREEHLVPNIPDLRNENAHTVPLGRELNRTETANTGGTQPQGNNNQEQQTTRSTGSTDGGSASAGGSTGSPTLPLNASAGTPLNNDGTGLDQLDEMTDFQIPGSHSEPNRPRSNSTSSTGSISDITSPEKKSISFRIAQIQKQLLTALSTPTNTSGLITSGSNTDPLGGRLNRTESTSTEENATVAPGVSQQLITDIPQGRIAELRKIFQREKHNSPGDENSSRSNSRRHKNPEAVYTTQRLFDLHNRKTIPKWRS